ncbi:phosphopantothenoylcysteine decarboxylase [Candidatus Omnitrophota bacterium]
MNLKNKKILLTCGPTWVPIDDMRIISNRSTGEMGQLLTKSLVRVDGIFTVLEGPVLNRLNLKAPHTVKRFTFYNELFDLMKTEVPKHDIIIHAAAVSDYKCKRPSKTKISSHEKSLTLDLVPTQKIITQIKKWNPNCLLVGFKLESTMNLKVAQAKTEALVKSAKCDFVIANSVSGAQYKSYLLNNRAECLGESSSKQDLARQLKTTLKNI